MLKTETVTKISIKCDIKECQRGLEFTTGDLSSDMSVSLVDLVPFDSDMAGWAINFDKDRYSSTEESMFFCPDHSKTMDEILPSILFFGKPS